MQDQLPIEVSPSAFFSEPVSSLLFEPAIKRWIFPDRLLRSVPDCKETPPRAAEFAQQLLRNLDIRYNIPADDLALIPSRGSALAVCGKSKNPE